MTELTLENRIDRLEDAVSKIFHGLKQDAQYRTHLDLMTSSTLNVFRQLILDKTDITEEDLNDLLNKEYATLLQEFKDTVTKASQEQQAPEEDEENDIDEIKI